jgi:hypothetical protein
MLVVLFRALKNGAGFDGTILTAVITMGLLAAVGTIIGAIAEATINESVRLRMQAELDALPVEDRPQPTN